MAKAYNIRLFLGCLVFAGAAGMALYGSAIVVAVPYPLPPGYLSSYDQGYDAMTPLVGSKYYFTFTPSSQLSLPCYEELRIAQSKSKNAPESADGFVAGCIDAARHALGIYYPCVADDPVCPRRR